jgi:hypothetical protein
MSTAKEAAEFDREAAAVAEARTMWASPFQRAALSADRNNIGGSLHYRRNATISADRYFIFLLIELAWNWQGVVTLAERVSIQIVSRVSESCGYLKI